MKLSDLPVNTDEEGQVEDKALFWKHPWLLCFGQKHEWDIRCPEEEKKKIRPR